MLKGWEVMKFLEFVTGEEGQSLTEYGLILSLFVVAVIWALFTLGPKITNLYTGVNTKID